MAVVVRQVLAQLAQVEEVVDAAQQMILRDVAFKIEGIEQRRLSACWLSHHHCTSASICNTHILLNFSQQREFFNTIGREATVAFLKRRRWHLPKPDNARQIKSRLLPLNHRCPASPSASCL